MIPVVHVITGLEIGGAETMLGKLVSGMDRQMFSNCVISLTDRGSLAESIEGIGIPVHALGLRRGSFALNAAARLSALLRATRPAIVQSWMYHADLLSVFATHLGASVPLVWNVRCSDIDMGQYSFTTRVVRRLSVACSSRPRAVIVNSNAGRRVHEQLGYRPRRWEIIPNGFDIERFRPDSNAGGRLRTVLRLAPQSVLVGMIARVDPMKDHPTFLEAARRVAASKPGVHFILVGEGTERLVIEANRSELTGRLHALGRRLDVERIVSGFDVFCLSSQFGEGFSNAIGEAMACEVPCVVTDVGDAASIVGPSGFCVPPRAPEALADALIAALELDAPARQRMGALARQRIEQHFALPGIVKRYEMLYEELVQQQQL